MGLKDALGLGDEEPTLDLPADAHAQGDSEPGVEELTSTGDGDMELTPPPAD